MKGNRSRIRKYGILFCLLTGAIAYADSATVAWLHAVDIGANFYEQVAELDSYRGVPLQNQIPVTPEGGLTPFESINGAESFQTAIHRALLNIKGTPNPNLNIHLGSHGTLGKLVGPASRSYLESFTITYESIAEIVANEVGYIFGDASELQIQVFASACHSGSCETIGNYVSRGTLGETTIRLFTSSRSHQKTFMSGPFDLWSTGIFDDLEGANRVAYSLHRMKEAGLIKVGAEDPQVFASYMKTFWQMSIRAGSNTERQHVQVKTFNASSKTLDIFEEGSFRLFVAGLQNSLVFRRANYTEDAKDMHLQRYHHLLEMAQPVELEENRIGYSPLAHASRLCSNFLRGFGHQFARAYRY